MGAVSGRSRRLARAQRFISLFCAMKKPNDLKRILLVEDSENDIEMTLEALNEHHLLNQVDVVRYVVKPVDFAQFTEALKVMGCFWAILNESPIIEKNP
jgi:hypothetical protein